MRYKVHLKAARTPSFMVTCNDVVIHATSRLRWTLGHEFEIVRGILQQIDARWEITGLQITCPRHSHFINYDGEACAAVIMENDHVV